MDLKDAISALKVAEPERDHILISAGISRGLHLTVTDAIQASRAAQPAKRFATVFLTTNGGDPDGAFRIARCLRHHYPDGFRLVVPSWCKSAGTLIAIAATEIGIGDLGELGPLDIQVNKGSELYEQSSGLDIQEALGKVTAHAWETFRNLLKETRSLGLNTSISTTIATQVSSAITTPIVAQIDPMRLGELQRAMRIAHEYGTRLDQYSQNLRDDGLNKLIQGYPSHSFVIDRKEAKEIFTRVTALTEQEQQLVDATWHILCAQHRLATFVEPEANDTPESNDDNHQGSNHGQPPLDDQEAVAGEDDTTSPDEQENGIAEPTGLRVRKSEQRVENIVRVL